MQLEQFFLSDVAVAFSIDGLNETHPIVQTVSDPDEINELFDTISYSKVRKEGRKGGREGRREGMGRREGGKAGGWEGDEERGGWDEGRVAA